MGAFDPLIYVPFPDGVFTYRCRECSLICCNRSSSFDGSLGLEIEPLLGRYPALACLATQRRGDVVTFATPSGRCFFLSDDNRCIVERDHGKESKPSTCRAFPFNSFLRIGRAVVAGVNWLCPLRLVVPARPGETEGTHATIETELRRGPYLSGFYYEKMTKLRPARGLDPDAALACEIAFRDACAESLGSRTFAETVLAASRNAPRLEASVARWADLWGLDDWNRGGERDRTDDILLALASMIRLDMLALSAEGILRALALSELVLRRVQSLPGISPTGPADAATPRGASEVLSSVAPAIRLLACADEPADFPLRVRSKKVPPFGDAAMTFAAFQILRAVEQPGALGIALEEALRSLPAVSDRTALLVELGGVVGPATRRGARSGLSESAQ